MTGLGCHGDYDECRYDASMKCMMIMMNGDMMLVYHNASAGQINGYGALCRHKPIVTLGSTGCMMIRKCLADEQAHVPLKDTEVNEKLN
ncbi:hypothetical protein E3N88_14042 [Mikania micrantha]|uniref:Uncharacterized protein n=1 Tax=Mikania micrantha TaxID=192012 RepID=A0A5N6P0P1_9ASTR|nr:hypothetical protein E3N88_14042 [Mikania micrantha]